MKGLRFAALVVALTLPLAAAAQAEAPVLKANAIIQALDKDIVLDGAQPSIDLQVQFDFDSAVLRPQGRYQLDQLAMALNDKALVMSGFELAGHTDAVGSAVYNRKLSLERAYAVKAYLQAVHGIAPARLQALGFGFERLADPLHPTAPINRRVEVRRVAMVVGGEAAPRPVPAPAPAAAPAAPWTSGGRLVPTPR